MSIQDTIRSVREIGSIALLNKTDDELRGIICDIVNHNRAEEVKSFAATHLYSETSSKTVWRLDKNSNPMRYVWIIKEVTRFQDMPDLRKVEAEHVMCVDKAIASQLVDLLNSQEELSARFQY